MKLQRLRDWLLEVRICIAQAEPVSDQSYPPEPFSMQQKQQEYHNAPKSMGLRLR